MTVRLVVPIVGIGFVTACAAIAGLEDPSDAPEAVVAPRRDARADDPTVTDTDAGGPPEPDAAPPCTPGVLGPENNAVITAKLAFTPPTIDGDGSDWRCVDRIRFETGGFEYNMPSASTAEIAMQWSASHLFVWARVQTVDPVGSDATQIHRNDSFSLYVTAPSPGIEYRANDHRLVFDGAQRVAEYVGGNVLRGSIADGIVAVSREVVAQGNERIFEIEASIAATATGRTAFAEDGEVRVSFQINDVDAQGGISYRLWYFATDATCQCGGTPGGPSCNLQCTGKVVLK